MARRKLNGQSGAGPPHSRTLARRPQSLELPPGFGARGPCGALDCPGSFMVPMHGIKAEEAFHEPPCHLIEACLGKAALKTHALQNTSRPPSVSEPCEAFGVRPIYRRLPSGVGRPSVHGPNAAKKRKGSSLMTAWFIADGCSG